MNASRNIYQDGPHLQSAVICEKVLVEGDGVKSAIRIVDRFTRTVAVSGDQPNPTVPPLRLDLSLLLRFTRGEGGGKSHPLRLEIVNPHKESSSLVEHTLSFQGSPEQGTDFIVKLKLELPTEGTYWINVFLGEVLVTRVPMTAVFLVSRRGGSPKSPDQLVS